MLIMAIRDRMLDYFQAPIATHRKSDAISSVVANINSLESNGEISQAPEHFEIWILGEVDDAGHITPRREFVANCSSYIRGSVWQRKPTPGGATEAPGIPPGGSSVTRNAPGGPAHSNGA